MYVFTKIDKSNRVGLLKNIIVCFFLLIISCTKKAPDQPYEDILVRIRDKTISVNEFVRRAEYTIRPRYCNGDNYIHKKIILNSLIAEKLLALEAGNNDELSRNEQFQDYLRGRKEQAMRQWLYDYDFYEKVKLDTNEIKKIYKCAGRNYKVAYYTIKDSVIANLVQRKLRQGRAFTKVLLELGGDDKIPQREISWDAQEHEAIHIALFSEPLKKDQVIGPLKIEKNYYTVIKVLGWTDRMAISDNDIRQRWNEVKEKLRKKHANVQYRKYVSKIMRGKRVKFTRDTFYKLVNIVNPFFIKSEKQKKNALNQRFWHKDREEVILDDIRDNVEKIRELPLLQIDGEIWTVHDFEKELNLHSLVFRKKKIKRSEFAEQLKFAIADMIRDKYITKEAYKKGYDKLKSIDDNTSMWRGYLSAIYHRNKYLESIGKQDNFYDDYLGAIEKHLNPYIDSLQERYSKDIEIDICKLKNINLTNINLLVQQENVPFSAVVPGFPMLTTDDKLDYGRRTE